MKQEEESKPIPSDVEADKLLIDSKDNYKAVHHMSPQEIKNEKIDMIYKFKVDSYMPYQNHPFQGIQ